jgi:hypothetical protein
MSKGPGRLQRLILDSFEGTESLQQNKLIWKLAENEDQIKITGKLGPDLEVGSIKDSFSKGIQRAINDLCSKKHLVQNQKKLLNLNQFARYYPYKTSRLEIISLRKRILPLIKEFVDRNGPVFGVGSAEIHGLQMLSESDRIQHKKAVNDWRIIEDKIISIVRDVEEPLKTHFIALLMKGRQLLLDDRAGYGKALIAIMEELGEVDGLGPHELALLEQLNLFYRTHIRSLVRHNLMKGQIYAVAGLSKGEKPHLKTAFKEYLLRKDPSFIRGLPDHKDGALAGRVFAVVGFGETVETRFSGLLDKLIDRYAFSPFHFLQLNRN